MFSVIRADPDHFRKVLDTQAAGCTNGCTAMIGR